MPNNVSILGCGWLGLPLACELINSGYAVKGSTTSANKMTLLRDNKIMAFKIVLGDDTIDGSIENFLCDSSVLIIDIPLKVRSGEDFVSKIKLLIPQIEKSGIGHVIFVSSTSVYADDNSTVTDKTSPASESESGRQLLFAEELLRTHTSFHTTIIRFGGLIGSDRHPIKSLSGQCDVANPDAPINLIHRDDCIGIIKAVIQQKTYRTIIAVAPFHPTRINYYTLQAEKAGLQPPQFSTQPSVGKTILSNAEELLQYQYIHHKA